MTTATTTASSKSQPKTGVLVGNDATIFEEEEDAGGEDGFIAYQTVNRTGRDVAGAAVAATAKNNVDEGNLYAKVDRSRRDTIYPPPLLQPSTQFQLASMTDDGGSGDGDLYAKVDRRRMTAYPPPVDADAVIEPPRHQPVAARASVQIAEGRSSSRCRTSAFDDGIIYTISYLASTANLQT